MLSNMNDLYRDKVLKSSIEVYGKKQTLIVTIEELSGLSIEICKVLRGSGITEDLYHKIADVEIMLSQLHMIIDDDSKIDNIRSKKLDKLSTNVRSELGL